MHPFEVMAEPIRRRKVDILASGEHTSGPLEQMMMLEYGVGRGGCGADPHDSCVADVRTPRHRRSAS